jgi:hypothetical protein
MAEVLPMPRFGDVFADVRGGGRTMRISYHRDQGTVIVSLWVGTVCRGTFRMAAGDLNQLISALTEIKRSVEPASSGPEAAVVPAPRPSEAPIEQTGEMAATADGRPPIAAPVLRVA